MPTARPRELATQQGEHETARTPDSEDRNAPSDLLGLRIAEIDVTDPHRRRKMFRAFLEVRMLSEFGTQIQLDPRFTEMVDAVEQQMGDDPSLAAAVDEAMQALDRQQPTR